jgi:uncharacterized integral membrane protein
MRFLGLVFRYVVLLLLCAVTVSFVLSNDQAIALQLFPLPYEMTLPLYALAAFTLLLGLLLGLAIGGLHSTGKLLRLRRDLREKTQHVNAMQQQITALELERTARAYYPAERTTPPSAFLPAEAVTPR